MACRAVPRRQRPVITRRASARAAFKFQSGFFRGSGLLLSLLCSLRANRRTFLQYHHITKLLVVFWRWPSSQRRELGLPLVEGRALAAGRGNARPDQERDDKAR